MSSSPSASPSSSASATPSASPSVAVGDEQCVYLQEAKDHLRVTGSDDDSLIDTLLDAATSWMESYLNRKLLTAACVDYFDSWPTVIRPRWSKLIAVTTLQYKDSNGTLQTWSSANYDIDTDVIPGRIMPGWNKTWPTIRTGILNPITLTYTAGYGSGHDDVPPEIRAAILLLVGHLYEHREETAEVALTHIPLGVRELAGIHRVMKV